MTQKEIIERYKSEEKERVNEANFIERRKFAGLCMKRLLKIKIDILNEKHRKQQLTQQIR